MKTKLLPAIFCGIFLSCSLTVSTDSIRMHNITENDIATVPNYAQTNNSYQNALDNSHISYNKLMNSFNKSKISSSYSYPDNYAGAYLDNSGLLHINIVSNKNLKKYKAIVNNDTVIFSNKKFSLNTLLKVQKLLANYMEKYDITSIALMEDTDTLDVKLKDANNEAAITKIVTKSGYDSKCLHFIVSSDTIKACINISPNVYRESIYPRTEIQYNSLSI